MIPLPLQKRLRMMLKVIHVDIQIHCFRYLFCKMAFLLKILIDQGRYQWREFYYIYNLRAIL